MPALLENTDRLSLIIFDIDHFKEYNDKFGHLQGDRCLQMVSENLKKVFEKDGHLLCRFEMCIRDRQNAMPGTKNSVPITNATILRLSATRYFVQSERHPLFEMDGKAVDKIHSLFYSVSRPNQGNCLFARPFTSLYLSLLLYNFLKYVSMYFSIGIVPQLSKKILKQFIREIRFIILINLPLLTLTPKYMKIRYEGILLPPYPEKLLLFPRPVQTLSLIHI